MHICVFRSPTNPESRLPHSYISWGRAFVAPLLECGPDNLLRIATLKYLGSRILGVSQEFRYLDRSLRRAKAASCQAGVPGKHGVSQEFRYLGRSLRRGKATSLRPRVPGKQVVRQKFRYLGRSSRRTEAESCRAGLPGKNGTSQEFRYLGRFSRRAEVASCWAGLPYRHGMASQFVWLKAVLPRRVSRGLSPGLAHRHLSSTTKLHDLVKHEPYGVGGLWHILFKYWVSSVSVGETPSQHTLTDYMGILLTHWRSYFSSLAYFVPLLL